MKFRNTLAATAAVAALAASMSATALTISTATVGGQATPFSLASELNVSADADAAASLVALLEPTTGSLPSGNVLLVLTLTNATFNANLAGSNVVGIDDVAGVLDTCDDATISISSGGLAGGSSVTFLVSNAQGCEVANAEGLQFTGAIRPAATGTVSVSMALTTEASNPVDGAAATANLITRTNAFSSTIVASTTDTEAALPNFLGFGATDGIVGSVTVNVDTAVNTDFTGADAAPGDLAGVTVSVTGDMSAYGGAGAPGVYVDLNNSGTGQAGEELTIAGGSASRTFTGGDIATLAGGARNILLVPNGTSPILASVYTASVTLDPDTAAALIPFGAADNTNANFTVQSVSREGTQITMPWFASGTQAGLTGSNNLVRIGNTGASPVSALYAQILNASDLAFVNPGVIQLPVTIAAGGTVLISSQQVEDAIGDSWGTGDVQITVEAPEETLTARRLIFNGGQFTEIASGTVFDDNN